MMEARKGIRFFLLVALCLGAAACAGLTFKNYGRIDPNAEVTRAFEHYQVNPEFRYYISGSDFTPNALMGLNRAYRLDPRTLWKEVTMTPEMMKEIVEHMKTKAFDYHELQYGFEISDDTGRPIGVWYSILTARTFIHKGKDGTVRIDTPDLDTYEKFERQVESDSKN